MTATEVITCTDCGASVTDSFDRLVAVCGSCRSRWVALAVLGTPSRSTAYIASVSARAQEREQARRELGADYIEDDFIDFDEPDTWVGRDVQSYLRESQS